MSVAVASKSKTTKVFNRRHWIVPEEDTVLMVDQKPCVLKFWHQCWLADPYGSRWMKLATNLSDSAFRFARRALEAMRLFIFRRISSESDGRTSYWEVRNLHGARVKDFWRGEKSQVDTASNKRDITSEQANTATNKPDIVIQTPAVQAFQNPSGTPQEHISNSSKELLMCVSSTPNEILQGDETAIAPFGGASPQTVEGVEEKDLPMATDCTTLTLVDATESQPTSLLAENQNSGVEQKDCHEGFCSAAPAAQHEQNLTNTEILDILDAANQGVCPSKEAIADLLETPHARSLLGAIVSNPQWGINLSDYSTVPQDFAQNSKLRSQRLSRLKSYAAMGQCPPEEFLQECQNDPVLRIQVKRMGVLRTM
ncbi:MAG: hypothetical protein HWQ38_24215 [Nostoc sp. NMS7]|uniref:hypothetical protein n=1 Tax=Nostoc sp. NMS7 TaxID=2815391 RepID=UPI0025CFF809|nr:hypothetical protein [Nostoc sp. NMS7]MBN3949399.1 hypothetical protein [Nostoc sp. NMS7]